MSVKKIVIIIFLLLILAISGFIVYMKITGLKKLDSDKIDNIVMVMLPSPPHYKEINKEEEINQIVHIINASNAKFIGFNNQKGWSIMIKFSNNKTISFIENNLIINNFKYEVEESMIDKLQEVYADCESVEKLFN